MNTLKTILIVEDEPMTCKLLQHILGKTYNVIACDNAKQGLECLKTNSTIDCVLSDLYMPEIDGKEFILQIRQNLLWAKIPVIILSGAQESDVRISCLEIGADDFITKPFNPKEVQLKIEALLRRNHYVGNHKKNDTMVATPIPMLQKYTPWWKRLLVIRSNYF